MPQRLTTEDFIKRAKEIHGDKYDYSKVDYVNAETKVVITCKKHGDFSVKPNDHIHKKSGCSECSGVKHGTTDSFIQKAKIKYGDKYDYSKVNYKNSKTKVCIICHEKDVLGNEHGEFWQRPNDHLNGYECPKCKNEYRPTTEEWVNKAKYIHGDKYDYSRVIYNKANEKVCIICPLHGEFWQRPSNHINGANCPECNCNSKSKMEENIAIMLSNSNIKYQRQKTFPWLKHKRHLFLDFYIPYKKVAVEVMGEQHFVAVKRFGGEEYLKIQQERDKIKQQLCEEHGIKLFYITKKEYNIKEIVNYVNTPTNKKQTV